MTALPFAPFWPQLTFKRTMVNRRWHYVPYLDGHPLPLLNKSSRRVYDGGSFVVKVEKWAVYKQNLIEAAMWNRLATRDRKYFVRVLGYGRIPRSSGSFTIQKKLSTIVRPKAKSAEDNQARALYKKYHLSDYGSDQMTRVPRLKIHDFGIVKGGDDSSEWDRFSPEWVAQAQRLGRPGGLVFRRKVAA